ncbi:VSK receptor [Vibrio sinaloensis]|uniref:VSK receptor n=1 Tax=Photobacterium sp. (strain ATCC 43367) TaxID=379097 RepID=UPI002A63FC33|nr:VSK receptor [Vibrio sinaloensis]MDN3685838.1 VSK receptor [Vibrio sinaloensis]
MDWLIDALNGMLAFMYRLLMTLVDAISDLVSIIVDSVLSVVNTLISGILATLSAIPIPEVVPLPSGVAWVASQVGVPQMIIIISASLVIRLSLQLIPFVRLGS